MSINRLFPLARPGGGFAAGVSRCVRFGGAFSLCFLGACATGVTQGNADGSASAAAPPPVVVTGGSTAMPEPAVAPAGDAPERAGEMTEPEGYREAPPVEVASNSVATPSVRTGPANTYTDVKVAGPYLAMTFDDGPSPDTTPKLLDMLRDRGIHATFYVVGKNAAEYPQILQRMVAEGHEVANHSWSHSSFTQLSTDGVRSQLDRTNAAILAATGRPAKNYRPPYGAINSRLKQMIMAEYGMPTILWSVDPLDWKRPGSAVVTQRIVAGARPGAIILAHDIHAPTVAAMPAAFDALLAKGYVFVTVSELIAMQQAPIPAATASTAAISDPAGTSVEGAPGGSIEPVQPQ